MSDTMILMVIQSIIIIILLFLIILLIRQGIALKYEKRIGKYSISPVKNKNNVSTIDKTINSYKRLVKKLRKFNNKIYIFNRSSKRYEKYVSYGQDDITAIDYITNKILISIMFILLTIFSQVLQRRVVTPLELIINIIIGYNILNIYLRYQLKLKKKLIKNEMLKAVIVMNNAFKAGKSTLQAVEIASKELPEPIRLEFKKIYNDMQYGLSVDVAFQRFTSRIDIEEARYLSSSLTTLNKTGGNIIKVFSSIERTLFSKKKLKEELKNLTSSSNLIVKILLFIPFVFSAIIYILNPTYFNPLFSSTLGYIACFLIVLLYSLYIWFLSKIMKVKV